MTRLYPRQPVPELSVATLAGAQWVLSAQKPERFTLLVFYRGLHCPICRKYIGELDGLIDEFAQRGVNAVAISNDVKERAQQAKETWGLKNLTIGYAMGLDVARRWGLFISSSRGKTSAGIEEPAQFSEPGIFLIRADGTLYWSQIQTMPFARPVFKEMLSAIDFIIKNDYPARGEVLP
ncbi:MAG TPA: peroxiredoxin-like family protein [Sulfuricaulis sp.]|jgi:peroxiredoxin|nr:peroxiredoxin-like family protein [Sulfuricaulis sp.]